MTWWRTGQENCNDNLQTRVKHTTTASDSHKREEEEIGRTGDEGVKGVNECVNTHMPTKGQGSKEHPKGVHQQATLPSRKVSL